MTPADFATCLSDADTVADKVNDPVAAFEVEEMKHLLADAINARRPAGHELIIPQVDYRLWKSYHATHVPHHLTRTIMY